MQKMQNAAHEAALVRAMAGLGLDHEAASYRADRVYEWLRIDNGAFEQLLMKLRLHPYRKRLVELCEEDDDMVFFLAYFLHINPAA